MNREQKFRIAVRRFTPFEQAIHAQWETFEGAARTGLALDVVAFDLHDLEAALFHSNGMRKGDWDIAFVNTDWIASMHAQGAAVDLAPLLAATPLEGFPEAWPESLLRLQRFGGAVLGVPYHDGPECLIFRRDLFEDEAVQHRFYKQFSQLLAPPRTWTEFHRVARFFRDPENGMYGTVFAGLPDGHNSVYDFLLQLWTRNGELISQEGEVRFNTPAAAEALGFYRDMLTDGEAVPPDCARLDSIASGELFAQGKIAMMVNWFGFAAHAHTAAESAVRGLIDVAPVPAGSPGRSVSLNVYWLLALASGSPHRQIAERFLLHTQTAEMDLLTSASGAIGCRRSTWRDAELNAMMPFYHRLEELHEYAREIPQRADWPRIAAIIDQLVTAAAGTQIPVAELLAEADARWKK